MKTADIKQYLSLAGEMEADLLLMDQALLQLNQKINSLGRSKRMEKPQRRELDSFQGTQRFIWTEAVLLLLLVLLCWVNVFFCDIPYPYIPAAGILATLGCGGAFFVGHWNQLRKLRRDNSRREWDYENKAGLDRMRLTQEQVLLTRLIPRRNLVKAQRDRTKQALNSFYSAGVLPEAYRNLLAVSRLLYYLESGQCVCLQGSGGAYELLEQELRLPFCGQENEPACESQNEVQQELVQMLCNAEDMDGRLENESFATAFLERAEKRDLAALNWIRRLTGRRTACTEDEKVKI